MARYNKTATQILAFLSRGLVLGYIKKKQRKELIKECDKMWYSIDRNQLFDLLRVLRLKKFIDLVEKADGKRVARITKKGLKRALEFQMEEIAVKKPKKWDGKWRLVVFDIPEAKKKFRDSLRKHLKRLGFHEFQKSVFIFPYFAEKEVTTLINLMDLRKYVRYIEASIPYDTDVRKIFKI